MSTLAIIGNVLVIAGALIFATAALGIVRFPDAYTRISAVGTAGGIGIILVVTGTLLHQPTVPDTIKVIIVIVVQLATSAIGSMAIARSAYLVRTPLFRSSFNDLAPAPTHDDPVEPDDRAPRS